MATSNQKAVTETAEMLLKQIKASAEGTTVSSYLLELAQAFALVAGNDPKSPPPAPRVAGIA